MVSRELPVRTEVIFPVYFYSLSLWLHIVSLSLWIGTILFFLFVFGPAVHALSAGAAVRVLNRGRISLQSVSSAAVILLVVTGIFNLLARGAGSGLALNSGYYAVLSIKLFLFFAMVFHYLLQAVKYAPQLASLTAQAEGDLPVWPEPLLALWRRWFFLLKINATLGLIVLLLGLALTKG